MNTYWNLFVKSGEIEQYLKYKGHSEAVENGNGYADGRAREQQNQKDTGGCN